MSTTALSWLFVLGASVNSCLGNLLLKKGSTSTEGIFALVFNPYFIGGMFFYFLNVLLFSMALKTLPVSIAYPVLSVVGFVILAFASSLVFGESLSVTQWLGIIFSIVGIFLLSGIET